MTERQYLENRIKEILDNLSKAELSLKYRKNQENALRFFVTELKKSLSK